MALCNKMVAALSHSEFARAASALSWWAEAGVDTLVDETPRNWLTQLPKVAARAMVPSVVVPDAPVVTPLPDTLMGFTEWFRSDSAIPGAGPSAQRVIPTGDTAAKLMILVDMPEAEDAASGLLLSGEAGALFDKMLGALGFDRATIWFSPMIPTRIAGGTLPPESQARITEITRHHVSLVRPQKLWLMGRAASRAILGMDEVEARGRLHLINHDASKTDVIASVHPRVLLQTPKRKAEVWADMQRLIEEKP